jgi:hypothetical protein
MFLAFYGTRRFLYVDKKLLLALILSHMNPVHNFLPYFHFSIIHPSLRSQGSVVSIATGYRLDDR